MGSSPRSWRESIKHLWLRGKCRADPKWVGRRCNSVDAISPESFAKALRCGDQTRRNTAPCAVSIKFRGQVRRQTRRNLQADSRESRVRRVMDGVECHRESGGHLRRLWAPRMRSKRRRGGLDSSIRGKEAGMKVHQVGSQLESLHSVRIPPTSWGMETISRSVWGKGSNLDDECFFHFIPLLHSHSLCSSRNVNLKSKPRLSVLLFLFLRAWTRKTNPRFPVVWRRDFASSLVCF